MGASLWVSRMQVVFGGSSNVLIFKLLEFLKGQSVLATELPSFGIEGKYFS